MLKTSLILTALFMSPLFGQVLFPANGAIVGPATVEVGELARLQVEGELVDWGCLPKSTDGQAFGENNQNFVISFRKPGEYDIVAAVYKDGSVKIQQLHIKVSGVPQKEDPEPDDPELPNVELGSDNDIVADTVSWCEDLDKTKVGELGAVFQLVCEQIHSGELPTGNSVITKTAELTQTVNLEGLDTLMGAIQALISSMSDSGDLETIDQHYILWRSIAEGLTKYATS